MNVFDFWIDEYGDCEESRDCCGRKVLRSRFGRYDSRYGWTVQRIAPYGSDFASNLHIVNVRTAQERRMATAWCTRATRYTVEKNDCANVPYDYARKDFCIMREERAQDIWTETFGSSEFGVDFTGRAVIRSLFHSDGEGGWNIDHILPRALGGRDVTENMQITSVAVNSLKAHSETFEIDGVTYRIMRCVDVSEAEWGKVPYDYEYKDYCIVKKK